MAGAAVLHSADEVFIGREPELAQLHAGLRDARSGHGSVCLVAGPAGIGKTRLVEQLCTAAAADGALVLWGRCWEDRGAPAYWPWVQILRALLERGDAGRLAELAGAADPLAQLLPELSAGKPVGEPGRSGVGAAEDLRFQLFDSISRFIAAAATDQASTGHPLVLVLDDAHAADEASLLLLRFLARDSRNVPILLLATYRTDVPLSSGPLAEMERRMRCLRLDGLTAEEVQRFVAATGISAPLPELVEAVHEATDGIPLLLERVIGTLEDKDSTRPAILLTDDVHDILREQLRPLPSDTLRVLGYASVLGRPFDLTTVRYIAHRPDLELKRLLETAVTAGVLVAEGAASYRFAHGLLRQTLYVDLSRELRGSLHRRVGDVLEGRYAADPEPHTSELAFHFVAAIDHGQSLELYAAKALDYSVRAARRAGRLLAYEESEAHYQRALSVLERWQPDDLGRRCDLLLALGGARRRAGRSRAARDAYREAGTIARSLGSSERLGRAALGFGGGRIEYGAVDQEQIELLEEASAQAHDTGPAMRSRLLARLAIALYFTDQRQRRLELANDAVEVATEAADASVLGIALSARHFAGWGPHAIEQRLADAEQLIGIARRTGDRALLLEGRIWRIVDLLELAEFDTVFAETASFSTFADELRMPLYQWYAELFAGMRALLAGELADAEQHAERALRTGNRIGAGSAAQFYGVQLFVMRREQGRLAELEDAVVRLDGELPAMWTWRSALALLHAEDGRTDLAQRELDAMADGGFSDVPEDVNWLVVMALLADLCATLGDAPRARALYDALLPFATRIVTVASAVACLGPVAYYLGLLAVTLGERDLAEAHFADTLDTADAAGARSWSDRARRELARLTPPGLRTPGTLG